jgi:hypothetical protein
MFSWNPQRRGPMAVPRKRAAQRNTFSVKLRRWGILGGLAAAAVGLGGWAIYAVYFAKPGVAIPIQQPSDYQLRLGETVSYNSVPPTSGPYAGATTDWGIHDRPIPNEIQVHMLRLGGVLVQYRPRESPVLDDPVAEGLKRLIGRLRTENFREILQGDRRALSVAAQEDRADGLGEARPLRRSGDHPGGRAEDRSLLG